MYLFHGQCSCLHNNAVFFLSVYQRVNLPERKMTVLLKSDSCSVHYLLLSHRGHSLLTVKFILLNLHLFIESYFLAILLSRFIELKYFLFVIMSVMCFLNIFTKYVNTKLITTFKLSAASDNTVGDARMWRLLLPPGSNNRPRGWYFRFLLGVATT